MAGGVLTSWAGRRRHSFSRYTVSSLVATSISQLVLYGVYSSGWTGAMTASTIAFVVGAVPHFVMIRWWAWGQRGWPRLSRQLVGYLVVTAIGGLVSVGLTTLADWVFDPLISDRATRTLVLNVTYVLSGLPVFLAKYAVFDRMFATGPDTEAKPLQPSH